MGDRVAFLPSGDVLDIDVLFDSLIEVGWGISDINSIVVFGSAARTPRFKTMEIENKFLWFKWRSSKRVRVLSNDIDVMVLYDREVEADEAETKETEHSFAYLVDDGYGYGFRHETARRSRLHLFRKSTKDFFRDVDEGNHPLPRNVLKEGIVVWGNNDLFRYRLELNSVAPYEFDEGGRVFGEEC